MCDSLLLHTSQISTYRGWLSFISTNLFLSWWRHQMETFSALLALCEGKLPVDSPQRLCKQWRRWRWWLETLSCSLWRHRNGESCFSISYGVIYVSLCFIVAGIGKDGYDPRVVMMLTLSPLESWRYRMATRQPPASPVTTTKLALCIHFNVLF